MPTTLILLPGLDGTGELFDSFIAAAPEQVTSIPVSYSTELSSYNDIEPLIRLGLPDNCVILAESFSGPLGVRLAADPRVRALILCNSFVSPPRPRFLRLFALSWLLIFRPQFLFKWFLLGKGASSDLLRRAVAATNRVPRAVLARRIREVLGVDERKTLIELKKPIFYLRGMNDVLVTSRGWREIKSLKPQAEVSEISGPHMLLQTAPEDSWNVIKRWLNPLRAN